MIEKDSPEFKERFESTFKEIQRLRKLTKYSPLSALDQKLVDAENGIREILYLLRTPEENATQRKVDAYT